MRRHGSSLTALAAMAAITSCTNPSLTVGQPDLPEGQLRVAVTVSGGNIAPGTTAISVNGGDPIEVSGSTTLTLEAGRYTVDLVGLPAHCAPSPSARRSVKVESAKVALLTFDVTCEHLRSGLDIVIGTTGADRDERFRLSVCAQFSCASILFDREVPSDTLLQLDLPPSGYYFVRIGDLADNCDPPSMLAGYVAPNQVSTLRATLPCWERTWFLARVTVTGEDTDHDFRLTVNERDVGAVTDTTPILVPSVATGRRIGLTQVAGNCGVTGANPQTVQLTAPDTLEVHFGVACVAMPTLRVTVTTTGVNLPDSLYVGVDLDLTQFDYLHWAFVPANGTIDLKFPLADGPHQVWLDGLRPGCTVQGAQPVIATTTAGTITPVTFSVTCL